MALASLCDPGHTHNHGCIGRYSAFCSIASKRFTGFGLKEAVLIDLQVIAQRLNGSALEAFWAATSYLLTSTVFQPTIASFSNVFGRRWVTTTSVILFLAGLLISGLAQNFTVLLAGRTVQGIGGGGIIVLTQLIICDLIPLRLRGQYFGIISGMYAIGSVSGPLLGGAFSEKVTWVRNLISNALFGPLIVMTALDLLDQSPLHRNGSGHDPSLHQASRTPKLSLAKAHQNRLGRLSPLHRLHDRFPDSAILGRGILPVVILAYLRASLRKFSRPGHTVHV